MPEDHTAATPRKFLCIAHPGGAAEFAHSALASQADVRVVYSVDDALTALREGTFDAVLLDSAELLPIARAIELNDHQNVLNRIAVGVCVLDADGVITWQNSILQAYPPEVANAIRDACTTVARDLAAGTVMGAQRRSVAASDDQSFELTTSAVRDADGKLERVVGLVSDTTQIARLRDKLDAIDAAGRELVTLNADTTAKLDFADRLDLLEERLIHYCGELLNFQHFAVLVLDPATSQLDPVLQAGLPEHVKSMRLMAETEGNGISGYVAATGESYTCGDLAHDPRYLLGLEGAKSCLTVPIRLHDRVVGVLNVESDEPNAFSDEDRQFAEIFSRYIGAALHTLKLLAAERSEATGQVASDVRSELANPLNDIVVEATRMLQDGTGGEEAAGQLRTIIDSVDQVKERLQSVTQMPAVRGLSPGESSSDPLVAGRRVLIADDEDIIRETIADVLAKSGAITVMARDGEEAVSLLQTQRFDLVLSDIKMPYRNGYEVFAAAKEARVDCPVILITGFGYDPEHSIVRANREGLAGVLFKPFKVEQLFENIRNAFGGENQ